MSDLRLRRSLIRWLIEPFYGRSNGAPLHGPSVQSANSGNGQVDTTGGLVVVADGVGGFNLCGIALRYVVAAERLPYSVVLFPWGHGLGRWHADLTDAANRDTKAKQIAQTIRDHKSSHPEVPIFLVAKSGGSAIVVKALEHLELEQIERVVLLAPALSPAYDLTAALKAVRRELVVFWSPLDLLVLGAGTRVFGTMDRVKTASAGLVGFRLPVMDPLDPIPSGQYGKLRQVRWQARMMATGYIGGHFGPDSPAFLRKYVVPLLRSDPEA
jgi:Serine aminopeptidase, S33